ncbi:MAG: hypothetical protein OER88_14085, partial [Planctomycetota bacterium]|nr:hypothetical protein [Planctomycetota bacterium]
RSGGFLGLGFLHALVSRRVRGAGLAFLLLLLLGLFIAATWTATGRDFVQGQGLRAGEPVSLGFIDGPMSHDTHTTLAAISQEHGMGSLRLERRGRRLFVVLGRDFARRGDAWDFVLQCQQALAARTNTFRADPLPAPIGVSYETPPPAR